MNWASIDRTLENMRDTPFTWGTHDCAIVAAEIILQATGKDLLAPVRGLWHDEPSAMQVINGSLEQAVDRVTGLPRREGASRMLDLCTLRIGTHVALGVNIGGGIAAPVKTGLKIFPLKYVVTAWRTL